MKKGSFILFAIFCVSKVFSQVHISEIHYDNNGADVNEGVEITGPAGIDVSGWSIIEYDEKNALLSTSVFSGVIDDEGAGFGGIWLPIANLNNKKTGLALCDAFGTVVEFLSYEGIVSPSTGLASGSTSSDIGVFQNGGSAADQSLQKTDSGWIETLATKDALNNALTLAVRESSIQGFEVYPNPVNNGIIQIRTEAGAGKEIYMYSVLGELVLQKSVISDAAIDISHIQQGVYILQVRENGAIVTRRIVVA